MALRANLLQAAWNYERQQGLGWAFSLKPALEELYPDAETRRDRLAEHTAYFNTQPTLASLALGAVAAVEEQRASGSGPDAEGIARIKGTLGSALAALGDRLFWFSLRPLAASIGVGLALFGTPWGAVLLWLCYAVPHLTLRTFGVDWGYRLGPHVLDPPFRGRIESAIRLIALAGSAAVGSVMAVAMAPGGDPRPIAFQAILAGGLVFGMLAALRARPSPTQWALGFGALCLIAGWNR